MENQTPEVVVSQRPKFNPILWVVIGSAILASGIVIGLVAGKYFQPASSTTSVSTIISSPNPFPTEIPVKESDPTADWKTSKNIILGASFKYPNDWIISETETYTSVVKNPVIATVVGACPDYSFLVSKYDPATNYARADKIVKGELDGQTTEVWENIDKCSEGMVFVNQRPKNNIKPKYVISFISANSNSKMVFDQILSTFKFVFLGYDLQRRTDVNAVIRPGLELYKFDHKQYPDSLNLLVPAYLITLPVDPVTKESYPYKVSVNKSDYNITVAMEDGTVLVVESPK